uniref:Uncharacterized protein n=1 Tax=Poecilia mexicana TaxID=48701 RepID=A0A3B3XM60_9TELE
MITFLICTLTLSLSVAQLLTCPEGQWQLPDTKVCNAPSWLCRQSSICLPQNLLCDGKRDCPEGDDEELCVNACPKGRSIFDRFS